MKSFPGQDDADYYSSRFTRLERLFGQVPFGLSILDRELLCSHANARMAIIAEMPADQLIGRSVRNVDPAVTVALEPLLLSSITEDRSFVETEVVILSAEQNNSPKNRFWLVCCHPLKTGNGAVTGCALIVQDITDQKIKESSQIERLKFEALLSDLSATFINVHVSEVDRKIEQGLQRIVEFLGFDRSTAWKVTPEGKMLCTHSFARPGIKPPPAVISNMVPVWEAMVHHAKQYTI
ncbi:MAG: PAS domain-containing protein [Desulfuromonadales bacterium]